MGQRIDIRLDRLFQYSAASGGLSPTICGPAGHCSFSQLIMTLSGLPPCHSLISGFFSHHGQPSKRISALPIGFISYTRTVHHKSYKAHRDIRDGRNIHIGDSAKHRNHHGRQPLRRIAGMLPVVQCNHPLPTVQFGKGIVNQLK